MGGKKEMMEVTVVPSRDGIRLAPENPGSTKKVRR